MSKRLPVLLIILGMLFLIATFIAPASGASIVLLFLALGLLASGIVVVIANRKYRVG